MGWCVVRGLGEEAAKVLIAERSKRRFSSLRDFLSRTRLKPIVLNELAMGDAFAAFGLQQRDALWEILADSATTQLGLFSGGSESATAAAEPGLFEPLEKIEAIQSDHQSYGLSIRGHPMQELRKMLKDRIPSMTTGQARRNPNGARLSFAGFVITRQRPSTAKGTVFATLEDEEGVLDLVIHKDMAEKYWPVFETSKFLVVSGKMQKDGSTVTLVVEKMAPVDFGDFRSYSHDFH
jgi:error-prone DNA polymerase